MTEEDAPATEGDALTVTTEQTRAWAASPEGQRAIREAVERAQVVIADLERARRIDPARLREPVTI
jgi:hypothetical protein